MQSSWDWYSVFTVAVAVVEMQVVEQRLKLRKRQLLLLRSLLRSLLSPLLKQLLLRKKLLRPPIP